MGEYLRSRIDSCIQPLAAYLRFTLAVWTLENSAGVSCWVFILSALKRREREHSAQGGFRTAEIIDTQQRGID